MSFHEVPSIFSPDCPSDSGSVAHDPERQQWRKWMKLFLNSFTWLPDPKNFKRPTLQKEAKMQNKI